MKWALAILRNCHKYSQKKYKVETKEKINPCENLASFIDGYREIKKMVCG